MNKNKTSFVSPIKKKVLSYETKQVDDGNNKQKGKLYLEIY